VITITVSVTANTFTFRSRHFDHVTHPLNDNRRRRSRQLGLSFWYEVFFFFFVVVWRKDRDLIRRPGNHSGGDSRALPPLLRLESLLLSLLLLSLSAIFCNIAVYWIQKQTYFMCFLVISSNARTNRQDCQGFVIRTVNDSRPLSRRDTYISVVRPQFE